MSEDEARRAQSEEVGDDVEPIAAFAANEEPGGEGDGDVEAHVRRMNDDGTEGDDDVEGHIRTV